MTGRKNLMEKIALFVVDRRRWILAFFAALIVFSAFSVRWIQVEEDITYYLPDDAEAKQGLFIMEDEFTTYGSARLMVKDISAEEAQELADQLAAVEDVALVQYDESRSHYRDGCALYDLTFADTADAPRSEQALERVQELVAERDTTLYSEVGFSLSKLVAEQMVTVLIFVIIVVLAVLVFTSSTYAEIPVMILTFLVAAVVNIGTHFLMGTISFVSNSVGVVLQLALSVDYAIIFCNRYKEEHERLEVRDAVVRALAVSIPEISASSLTTIAGLTAMTLMKFRLGVDLGITLIKAILCSLLTVFLFMPALLMLFGRAMDKTRHRRFVPRISFVGRFAYKTRFVIPVLFALLVAAGYWLVQRVPYAYSMDLVPAFRETDMERAKKEIRAQFGANNTVALLVPSGDFGAEKELLDTLSACPEVKSATGLATIQALDGCSLGDEVDAVTFAQIAGVDETSAQALFAYYAAEQGEHRAAREDLSGYKAPILDLFLFLHERVEAGDVELAEEQAELVRTLYEQLSMVRAQLTSENYSRLILDLDLPVQSEETFRFLDRIHQIAARWYDSGVVLTGDSVSALGFRDSFASDNTVVGLMSLGLVMLILFFTFKSFGMPLLLILVIQGSIWLNFSVATLKGDYVFFLCYLIVGAIQMGANIDYAIVVSTRYRELRETMGKQDAIIETLNLAFPTVITSGLMMVCAGLLVGFGVSQCIIAGMGYYVGTGTSISLVLILFALPQVLLLGDSFVSATTLRGRSSGLLGFLRKRRLRLAGVLLAAACVFALIAAPLALRESSALPQQTRERAESLLARTDELRKLADELEQQGEDLDALRYDFAQQLVTDEVGSAQLAEGEQQLAEGQQQYDEGLAQYEEGAALLDEAEEQYWAGAAQLADAQAQYDAGLAAYEAGQAQVEAARQELADGQARYDEGLAAYEAGQAAYEEGQRQLAEGQQQYDQALLQYEAAQAAMTAISPLYQTALALQQRVDELQQQYDEAEAAGDYAAMLRIAAQLTPARAALQTQLGGMSLQDLIARYQAAQQQLAEAEQQLTEGRQALDAGYAQAAEAEQQLAEAEQQLAEGKQALDEGYAQLAEAEQQLAEAEQQLAEGKQALDAGYAQLYQGGSEIAAGREELADAEQQLAEGSSALAESREQLEEGRKLLEENLDALNESLAALDAYGDEMERLQQGIRLLRQEPGVRERLHAAADVREVLDVSESWFRELRDEAEREGRAARALSVLLMVAAALAAAALLAALLRRGVTLPGAVLCAAAGLTGLLVFLFWRSRCALFDGLLPPAALVLAVCAALFSEMLFRRRRTARAVPAESD
uniref:RND family transporter n=1 Tax=uncultured bacterium Contig1604 TaxID=1393470 RepID=W0FK62_9BACT|nr:RND family transporter [uncultured bacterium Contig1604]